MLHYADTYYQKIATASSPQEKEIAGMILLDTFPPEVQLPPELQKLERSGSPSTVISLKKIRKIS